MLLFTYIMSVLQKAIFSTWVNVNKLQLTGNGVCILWKWEWTDSSAIEGSYPEAKEYQYTSESEPETEDAEGERTLDVTHTVIFKCIGSNRSSSSQSILKAITELSVDAQDVPVMLYPEPENPVDSEAIAFRARVSGKWHTIGYVVREVLPHVHMALQANKITSVKFSWVKHMVQWSRSSPGYYAGINVTTKSQWPLAVVRSASTR